MKTLRSYVGGGWHEADSGFSGLVDPCTEEEIGRASSAGIDFGAALGWAREQGHGGLAGTTVADRGAWLSAMAKAFATETAQRIVDDAVQILGARGVLADHPVDHLYRAVRALRIYEGTTEIQHLIIAGHHLSGGAR